MTPLRTLALAAILAAPLGAAAQEHAGHGEANGVRVDDAYAVSAGPRAPTAAAYMRISNTGDAPDRLVAAEGDAARRIELHTHVLEDGVARMRRLEAGIELPAGATVTLERGGRHVMLMGLTNPLEDGAAVELTLVFETAGRVPVSVPVDLGGATEAAPEHQH